MLKGLLKGTLKVLLKGTYKGELMGMRRKGVGDKPAVFFTCAQEGGGRNLPFSCMQREIWLAPGRYMYL